jgi:hypothetical protein
MRRLDRYIVVELLRVVVLTTAVLVTVIAFGATIKPLAHDDLLTAGQTIKYIVLAIVPMLQFALPFAAGFASTVTLHRMTGDNEILAAAVSGVSYRRLIAPIAAIGLALMLIMIGLTQSVIPRFWSVLEAAVALDVTRVFQSAIERGEPFEFGDRQIYADRVVVEANPEPDVDTRLILLRVAAAQLDEDGRIDKEVTANSAVVDIYRRPGVTYVMLAMSDTVAYDPEDGLLLWTERSEFRPIVLPGRLENDARHMTRGQLLALRRNPDSYGPVIQRRIRLAEGLRDAELWTHLDDRLRDDGAVELFDRGRPGRRFLVTAAGLEQGRFTGSGGTVTITQRQDGADVRRFTAPVARLERYPSGPNVDVAFDLVLENCTVIDLDGGAANQRERVPLENLAVAGLEVDDLASIASPDLVARARAAGGDRASVAKLIDELEGRIESLHDEITARLLSRYALSATGLLLITLGATLAMWLRESLPLTIYLWAFLPSILDLLLINTGEHMMRDGRMVAGSVVMWSWQGDESMAYLSDTARFGDAATAGMAVLRRRSEPSDRT